MASENKDEYEKVIPNRIQYSLVPAKDKELLETTLRGGQIKERDENVIISSKKGVFHQVLVTSAVLLLAAACGMPIGYSAVLLPQLYNSSESISIDIEMGSWIASVHSLSTPFGSLISGSIADRFGRRTTLLVCILPLLAGWVILATAQSYFQIIVGRIVSGASVGILGAPAQIIIAEIAEPKLRGLLIGAPYVSYSMGILIVYALGSHFHWRLVAWLGTILPILASISIYFLHESPVWLVRNGRYDSAMKALKFLRGSERTAKSEFNKLVDRFQQEKITSATNSENILKLCCERIAIKPLIIVNVFNFLQLLSGTYLVVFYAIDIISEFGGGVDPKKAAVMTALVRMLCTAIFCVMLLILRRRTILHISGIGSGLSCLVLGLYMMNSVGRHKTDNDILIAAVCLLSYISFNTPLMVMPGIMVGELFPGKIRGRVAGSVFAVNNILLFGLTKVFPMANMVLKSHGLFILFGLASLLASLFMFMVLPETKNKSLNDIEDYFNQDNWFWFSRTRNSKKIDLTA